MRNPLQNFSFPGQLQAFWFTYSLILIRHCDYWTGALDKSLPEEIQTCSFDIEARLKNNSLALNNALQLEERVSKTYREDIDKAKKRQSSLEMSITGEMKDYKRNYPEETADLDASVEFIDEYNNILKAIDREDLPRHEKRFKELLDRKAMEAISVFQNTLDDDANNIKDSIGNLNKSLQTIDYTPSTYIRLQYEGNPDREIREFQKMLSSCYGDLLGQSPEANEVSFQNIKALIDRFKSDERWTAKVTDVRNWLNFSASERNKEDRSERNYYSDSSGKSGGQKAKLAYTILASAIAYQFGLVQGETKSQSFRFAVVDEAFSKSDEANARYAMELFKQLNLQLLVVTPLDKVQVVKPYITAFHFVENNTEENNSKVHTIPIEHLP